MRVSRLMLVTLRDTPADAEIISHKLLLRGGYIKRVSGGIYAYMPLMWRVLKKITRIVQEEMEAVGGLQTLLPQLHPSDLWKKSGRWAGYTAGEGIMFHLKDRQGREFGLGPTHEEVITKIAGEMLQSYKQLPVNLYQIQTKFRDEIRPRFGLMRSREFIMKDAYSFHSNEINLKETYEEMNDAYKKIFFRSGIRTVAVDADSGAIGGASSQEFMVTADSGEDLILTSTDGEYSANQEKAISIEKEAIPLPYGEISTIETPKQNTIEELCLKQGFDQSQIVKVVLFLALLDDEKYQPVLVSIRGDQEINEVKLINTLIKHLSQNILEVKPLNKEQFITSGEKQIPFGYIGPDLSDSVLSKSINWNNKFIRIADKTASRINNFVTGANEYEKHKCYVNWEKLGGVPSSFDLRKAQAGDKCIHNKNEYLKECRGIEVGHIFQLGQKYSKSLNANFANESGALEALWMGCYGIGISRMAQAAVEQNHDKEGIIWPLAIAPFEVILIVANMENELQKALGENIYKEFLAKGIEVLLDDRKERAGVKLKDADLIGIPWRLVIGRDASSGKIEIKERSNKEVEVLEIETAKNQISKDIFDKRSIFAPKSL